MKKNVTYIPLTLEQYKTVRRDNSQLANFILSTGVRINEALSCINEWDGTSDHILIKTKKSGDKRNRIFFTKDAMHLLTNCVKKYRGMSVKTLQREITALSKRLGFEFTAHNLRATFATRLISNGVNLVAVQNLMNHADISTTALYIKYDEMSLRSALESLENLNTLDGMTQSEMKCHIATQNMRIKRLEEEINQLRLGDK